MHRNLRAARQARNGIEMVRRQLLDPTPRSMERCSGPLQAAIASMTELSRALADEGRLPDDDLSLRTELASLSRDLKNIGALLQNAARFHAGYAQLLGTGPTEPVVEYSAAARVAVLRAERNFVVHG